MYLLVEELCRCRRPTVLTLIERFSVVRTDFRAGIWCNRLSTRTCKHVQLYPDYSHLLDPPYQEQEKAVTT